MNHPGMLNQRKMKSGKGCSAGGGMVDLTGLMKQLCPFYVTELLLFCNPSRNMLNSDYYYIGQSIDLSIHSLDIWFCWSSK